MTNKTPLLIHDLQSKILDRQLDSALDQFNKWGVDFIMTDFMDRDDQLMVNFYERIARSCADHKIMIMYHGAYKPAGKHQRQRRLY